MTFQFHTCRQSNALKSKTLLHFSQVLLCSLAPSHIFMSPTFFSPLSLPLCLRSLSVCLSFALSSCRVHTVQCVLFLNEAFFSCSQPASLAEARPQLADCGSIVPVLIHRESMELAPKRERNGENEMRQKNIQRHSRGCYSYRCALGSKDQSHWLLFPFFPLETCT